MPSFRDDAAFTGPALFLARSARPDGEQPTVFVIDHDLAVRDSLSFALRFSGFDVLTFASGGQFMRNLPLERKGCLLVEFDLEDMTAAALIEHLNAARCDLPAIIMSARLRLPVAPKLLPPHVLILQKPFGQDLLLDVLRRTLGER